MRPTGSQSILSPGSFVKFPVSHHHLISTFRHNFSMPVSKSINDLNFVDARNGDMETDGIVSLEKSKTFPEIKENKIGYYVTKLEEQLVSDEENNAPGSEVARISDVKVLYLYKEKSIGTGSESFVGGGSVALQTGERTRSASLGSFVRTLMCCFRTHPRPD